MPRTWNSKEEVPRHLIESGAAVLHDGKWWFITPFDRTPWTRHRETEPDVDVDKVASFRVGFGPMPSRAIYADYPHLRYRGLKEDWQRYFDSAKWWWTRGFRSVGTDAPRFESTLRVDADNFYEKHLGSVPLWYCDEEESVWAVFYDPGHRMSPTELGPRPWRMHPYEPAISQRALVAAMIQWDRLARDEDPGGPLVGLL